MTSTRRRLILGAAAAPVSVLGGCVVAPYGPYHRPVTHHSAARLKGAWCRGLSGPPAVIEIALAPSVLMTATAQREPLDGDRTVLPLRITMTLPPVSSRFAEGGVRVSDDSGRVFGTPAQMRVFRRARLPADGWIDPARVRPSGARAQATPFAGVNGAAHLELALERGFTPDRIVLEGLQLEQDGQRHVLPSVELARPASARNLSDYRSAAMQARLQERRAACQRDTPKLSCENIIDHAQYSFETELPVAEVRGRWYRFDGRADEPIRGDLEIRMRRPEQWRMTAPFITVLDVTSGARRTAHFSEVAFVLSDQVPLVTPLFANGTDGSGDAQLSIEVLLPANVGNFELQLPVLLHARQRIAVPPIRFEKRYFDGGVEPLNC